MKIISGAFPELCTLSFLDPSLGDIGPDIAILNILTKNALFRNFTEIFFIMPILVETFVIGARSLRLLVRFR